MLSNDVAQNAARNHTVHGASEVVARSLALLMPVALRLVRSFEAGEDARDRQRKATSAGLASRFVLGPIRVSDSRFVCLIPNPTDSKPQQKPRAGQARVVSASECHALGVLLPMASRPALRGVSCGLSVIHTNGETRMRRLSLSFVFKTVGSASCCDGSTSTPGSRDPGG